MRRWQKWGLLFMVLVTVAAFFRGSVISGSWSFGPVKFTIDRDGHVSFTGTTTNIVTPVGTFSTAITKTITAADAYHIVFRDNRRPAEAQDDIYKIDNRDEVVVAFLNGAVQLGAEENRFIVDTSLSSVEFVEVMSRDRAAERARVLSESESRADPPPPSSTLPPPPTSPPPPPAPSCMGVRLIAADGGVFDYWAPHVNRSDDRVVHRIVGAAATPTCRGYWTVDTVGGVHAHGDAPFLGSLPGRYPPPVAPIRGIVGTRSGRGYWLFSEDGGLFAFGDANPPPKGWQTDRFASVVGAVDNGGHTPSLLAGYGFYIWYDHLAHDAPLRPNQPIVGGVGTPSRSGYWLVAADGGVFGYGAAGYFGSMAGRPLAAPIVGMAATPSGKGYWLAGADGGVFAFGDAAFSGSMKQLPIILNAPVVAIIPAS